jgi:mRNA interferase RelE/StbE
MDDYAITFARSARKELEKLPASVVQRVFPKIESLVQEPHPQGCRKIQGEQNLWRIRVGQYRVIYAVHDIEKTVDVIAVRHRSQAYR